MWRASHPRAALTPTPATRRALKAILTEAGADAGVYLAWVAQSADHDARRLRGEAPWPGGEVIARTDLESLSRHIPARLPLALAWDKRGRTAGPVRVSARPAAVSPTPPPRPTIVLEEGPDGSFAEADPAPRRYSFRERTEIRP